MSLVEGWVLAGQSNMEGSAFLTPPEPDATPDERVTLLSSAGDWEIAKEPLHHTWESYTEVHGILHRLNPESEAHGIDDSEMARRERDRRVRGAGLGMAFARSRARSRQGEVALLPAAHGGTTLEQWMPGHGGNPRTSTRTLYGSLMDRVGRANQRPGFQLRGVLWYQGESDATEDLAPTYADRLDQWIREIRDDLGTPSLEVLVVQLGRFIPRDPLPGQTPQAWDAVRDAQRTAHLRTDTVRCVSAIDLGLSDEVHIDAPGLTRLGRRLATLAESAQLGPDVSHVEQIPATADGHPRLRLHTRGATGSWTSGTLPGFAITSADGTPSPDLWVIDAHPDPEFPLAIEILCGPAHGPVTPAHHLAYGLGFAPVCRAVDHQDLPLPTFRPMPVRAPHGADLGIA